MKDIENYKYTINAEDADAIYYEIYYKGKKLDDVVSVTRLKAYRFDKVLE